MASGVLTVKVLGDASGFERTMGNLQGKLAGIGKAAALGAAGIAVGIAAIGVEAFSSLQRIERIGAQTDAALKSTGSAAGVTRSDIDNLAGSLENLTSVEAETITEGQNLLLTFTNVANKAGEGNDIFDQATRSMVDLSVAMGTDMTSASMLVGKALNDPIAGMSALSRAGVQFTAEQKEAIKAMVESGDTMGAQKIILGELTTQFGGSGEALGNTFTGKVEKLKHSFGTLTEEIVARLMPGAERLMDWAARVMPGAFDTLSSVAGTVGGVIASAFSAVADWWANNGPTIIGHVDTLRSSIMGWIDDVRPAIESWVTNVLGSLSAWWTENSPIIIAAVVALKDGIVDAVGVIVTTVQTVVEEWDKVKLAIGIAVAIMIPHYVALAAAATLNAAIVAASWVATHVAAVAAAVSHSAQVAVMVAKWIFLAATAMAKAAVIAAAWLISMGPIALVIAAVAGLVAAIIIHWDTIKSVISAGWEAVRGATVAAWDAVKSTISGAWESIRTGVVAGVDRVVDFLRQLPGKVLSAVGSLNNVLRNAGRALMDGLLAGIKAGFNAVRDFAGGIAGKIADLKGPLDYDRKVLVANGHALMQGLDRGLQEGLRPVLGTASGIAPAISSAVGGAGPSVGMSVSGGVSSGDSRMDAVIDLLARIAGNTTPGDPAIARALATARYGT